MLRSKSLAKEVSDVSKHDENEVANVCREKIVIRWLVHYGLWEFAAVMLADISVALTTQRAELSIDFCLSSCLCD